MSPLRLANAFKWVHEYMLRALEDEPIDDLLKYQLDWARPTFLPFHDGLELSYGATKQNGSIDPTTLKARIDQLELNFGSPAECQEDLVEQGYAISAERVINESIKRTSALPR